jgi:hypothetical protein
MLVTGTVAGALLPLDSALELDLTSVLYPIWQAGVAVTLAMALQRITARSQASPSWWDGSGSNIRPFRLSSKYT